MAREGSTIVGSGINPLKKDLCVNRTTQERHLGGTQVVVTNAEDASAGGSGLVTVLTVDTTAVKLPEPPLKYRRAISILNNSTNPNRILYIGFDSSVSTGTGFPIPPGATLPLQVNGQVEVYGIGATTGTDVRILELS